MIIVDTGFWLALANKNDLVHESAKKQFQNLANEKFITTWCVVTETCYLLQKRIGIDAPKIFIHKISIGKLQVFDLKQTQCDRIDQKLFPPISLSNSSKACTVPTSQARATVAGIICIKGIFGKVGLISDLI